MATQTTKFSLLSRMLRTLCCLVALAASSASASVVNWQSTPGGGLVLPQNAQSSFANLPKANSIVGLEVSDQLSFQNAPESSATSDMKEVRAAALSSNLQARDTDFEQAPPSTIANVASQSTTQALGAFDAHFASLQSYQFASAVAFAGAPGKPPTSAGGDPVPVPEMGALFPIVGLIVAVSCTRILRRRRATQLSTYRRLV
jgi:hypothetical protein